MRRLRRLLPHLPDLRLRRGRPPRAARRRRGPPPAGAARRRRLALPPLPPALPRRLRLPRRRRPLHDLPAAAGPLPPVHGRRRAVPAGTPAAGAAAVGADGALTRGGVRTTGPPSIRITSTPPAAT